MDKDTRNAIERATQRARKLLEEDFAAQLEGDFDVHRDGEVAAKAGKHLSARDAYRRERIVAASELDGADSAARIIRHHHEHFDGRGYPDGLAGESIPICSRIISVCDSYDAMSAARSYQNSRSHRDIMAILAEESGSKHDPAVVRAFSELIGSNPYRIA